MSRALRKGVVGLLLVVLSLAAVATYRWNRSSGEFNIVLIVLDAAAARYFGSYGNTLPTTPNLDAFFEEATRFERAYSQAPATIMSVGSLMSGKYPPTVFDPAKPFDLRNLETLPIVLAKAGFRTVAFSQNPWVSPKFGFGAGFQEFHLDHAPLKKWGRKSAAPAGPKTEMVDDVLAWIESVGGERFFLYVHLLPPHAPYTPPPPFARRFDPDYDGPLRNTVGEDFKLMSGEMEYSERDLEHLRLTYQEHLAFGDSQVGRILRLLEDRGHLNDSLVIFTSDHGEAFDEHGLLSHGTSLYDEMLHVPLGIRWPRFLGEFPSTWSGTTELRRLFATIADSVGVSGGNPDDSLFPMLRGDVEATDRLVRADVFTPFTRERIRAVVVWPNKLIVSDNGNVELYDLENDPGEKTNLAQGMPDLVAELRTEVERQRLEIELGEKAELGEGTREKLRSLGYEVD